MIKRRLYPHPAQLLTGSQRLHPPEYRPVGNSTQFVHLGGEAGTIGSLG